MLAKSDKAMVAAILAMAGQLGNEKLRERVQAAIRGDEPKPTASSGEIRRKVITGNEAARILGCTRRTAITLANSGVIKRVQLPGRTRSLGYSLASVEALVAQGGVA